MYANYGPINIIGSGGNINKLFRLAEEKSKKELKLPITSLRSLHNDLQPLSVEERMDRFGLKPDRAVDIVPRRNIPDYCRLHSFGLRVCTYHRFGGRHHRRTLC